MHVHHKNKVLFVFDCDVGFSLADTNNTFVLKLPRNAVNEIAKDGIENMFAQNHFASFTTTITKSTGITITEFDKSRKRDFATSILARNNKDDFAAFSVLLNRISEIQAHLQVA